MLANYHTLDYIVRRLDERLRGTIVSEAFTQHRDELLLNFSGLEEVLVVSCARDLNALYFHSGLTRAHTNSTDVLDHCIRQRVEHIRMHPGDRVVMVQLQSGDRLDMRFFGPKANVLLVEPNGTCIDAFKERKNFIGTTVEYRSTETIYDVEAIGTLALKNEPTIFVALKAEFPKLGSTLAQEVLHRADVLPTTEPRALDEAQIMSLRNALLSVLDDITAPRARVYSDEYEMPSTFSIIPLHHKAHLHERIFPEIDEAIRFFVARTRLHHHVQGEKDILAKQIRQRIVKAERAVRAVEQDLQGDGRADRYQLFGNLLMETGGHAERGATSITLKGESIPLQENLTLIQNAQRYFEKAKQSRAAQEQSAKRLVEMRTFLSQLRRLAAALDAVHTKEELKTFMSSHSDELKDLGVAKDEASQQLPFRLFTVDGGFEVWAGKSSKNNDELTTKYAKPNDLWFHARGASGSHVILKTNSAKGEPTKKAKEQAAGIAAYYSKMKNAKMVPVAMVEKKYVRKPKGAAPGSVILEREKVIFATPALPGKEIVDKS